MSPTRQERAPDTAVPSSGGELPGAGSGHRPAWRLPRELPGGLLFRDALSGVAAKGPCIARIMAMETLSITEAKNRFTEIADRAAAEHDHFTVTRNGRPHVMVVSVAEWDELQETIAVLSDPGARADLAESAEAAERGDFTTEEEMRAILEARLGRQDEG